MHIKNSLVSHIHNFWAANLRSCTHLYRLQRADVLRAAIFSVLAEFMMAAPTEGFEKSSLVNIQKAIESSHL